MRFDHAFEGGLLPAFQSYCNHRLLKRLDFSPRQIDGRMKKASDPNGKEPKHDRVAAKEDAARSSCFVNCVRNRSVFSRIFTSRTILQILRLVWSAQGDHLSSRDGDLPSRCVRGPRRSDRILRGESLHLIRGDGGRGADAVAPGIGRRISKYPPFTLLAAFRKETSAHLRAPQNTFPRRLTVNQDTHEESSHADRQNQLDRRLIHMDHHLSLGSLNCDVTY